VSRQKKKKKNLDLKRDVSGDWKTISNCREVEQSLVIICEGAKLPQKQRNSMEHV
jgi:hypothetical protein